jgi:uncharacterized protein YndB with AHSA1/START domain
MMTQQSVQFDTFTIERALPAPLSQVIAAFADPRRKRRWFAESAAHEIAHFTMAFEVGGHERACYRFKPGTPFAGTMLESDGVFLEIVPGVRIVSAATMTMGGRRISASLHTFEFAGGEAAPTRLRFTHQAAFFEGADGPAIRRAGWEQLFGQLTTALAGELEDVADNAPDRVPARG